MSSGTVTWVIGAGGLIGAGVVRAARRRGDDVWSPGRIPWTGDASSSLREATSAFALATDGRPWTIVWCAGVGYVGGGSGPSVSEADLLTAVMDQAAALPREIRDRGAVAISSSAGAAWGGARGAPFSELSPSAPVGEYGAAKLEVEAAARRGRAGGLRVLIARIGNVYGPGQSLGKQQGLISRLAVSALTRTPIEIFVPLDTIRDYVFVDDCAEVLLRAAERSRTSEDLQLKVIASGRPVTLGWMLAEFERVSGVRRLVIHSERPSSRLQPLDLRLRSRCETDLDVAPTPLAVGMARTFQDLRSRWLTAGDARLRY